MKKFLLFSILCIALSNVVSAQNYVHTWNMGPLTWNDFSHNSAVDGHCSYLEYYFQIDDEQYHEVDGVTYAKPHVSAHMAPFYSWADTNYRTPELLRYNQCIFALVEIYRRQLENDIQNVPFYDRQQLFDRSMRRLEEDIHRVHQDTREGTDTAELCRWEQTVQTRLDSTNDSKQYGFVDAPYRWDFSIGMSYQAVCGQLGDVFRNGLGMSMNFGIGFKRFFWNNSMVIGGSRCRTNLYNIKDSINDLYPNDELVVLNLYTSLGYSVIDNNRMRLAPFAGYGLMGYYFTSDEGSSMGTGNGCWHFGIDYNHYIHNQVHSWNFSPDYYNGDHSTLNLNVRLYATYNHFRKATLDLEGLQNHVTDLSHPTGFTINLQVAIGLTSGRTHCK